MIAGFVGCFRNMHACDEFHRRQFHNEGHGEHDDAENNA